MIYEEFWIHTLFAAARTSNSYRLSWRQSQWYLNYPINKRLESIHMFRRNLQLDPDFGVIPSGPLSLSEVGAGKGVGSVGSVIGTKLQVSHCFERCAKFGCTCVRIECHLQRTWVPRVRMPWTRLEPWDYGRVLDDWWPLTFVLQEAIGRGGCRWMEDAAICVLATTW